MSDAHKAVFLSYASQDAEGARKICEALRSAGVEVWFDTEGGLEHGDEWDAKIRKQIKDCVLFIPIISANTQARHEGYFRIEWELAAQRAMGIASGVPFILPVVIDDTREPGALVPDRFRAVQWTRLRNGDVPDDVKARFQKLWSHRVGALKGMAAEVAPVSDWRAPAENTIPAGQRPALLRRSLVAAGIVAAVVIGVWWTSSSRSKPNPSTSASTAASAGATEVQTLVSKARQILDEGDEANRETYALAEDLLKRAVALDPANALAWVTYADLSYFLMWHAIDMSDSRKEAMQRQAERARTLAPDSPDAIIVSADIGAYLRQDLPTLERQMLDLTSRPPVNWRAYRTLGSIYRFMDRTDDAIRALQRAYEVSNGLPQASADLVNVLTRRNRWLESEQIVAQALKKRATGRILWYDVVLRVYWRGDVAGAEAALASWPGWLLLGDRGAFQAWQTWFLGRQPDKAVAAMQAVPRDYLSDYTSTGPRAAFTARAHEMAGHAEAARTDWETAIQVCDRVLAMSPASGPALYWKAWALARLGNLPAAQAICTQMQQRGLLSPSGASHWGGVNIIPALWATVGRPEEALIDLTTPRAAGDERYPVTRAMLELDPAYDSIRGDPRFQKVVQQALAPPPSPSAAQPSNSADSKSVAVLAFANLSDDKDNEYFSDGISEELLNVLAKVPGLKVSARTSAFSFKGKGVAIPEIARQLGVAYVVEGSVRKVGSRVRITAQLIKANDGFHVWSDNFDRELKDIFAVQDEIAGLIAQKLELAMGTAGRNPRTVDPEAHRLVLEGRYYWYQRSGQTEEVLDKAAKAFAGALAIDPQFAEAHVGLGDVWVTRGLYRSMDGRGQSAASDYARARAEADRALELNPLLSEPHVTLGYVAYCEGRFADAEQHYTRAFAANTNNALAYHWHALLLGATGRLDQGLEEINRSLQLDPLSPNSLWSATAYLTFGGRLTTALSTADRALELRPGILPLHSDRAQILLRLGRKAEAVEAAREVSRDLSAELRWWADSDAIYVLRQAGLQEEAASHGGRVLERFAAGDYRRALVLAALGRGEEAMEALVTLPSLALGRFYFNPIWDPWRNDPRFEACVRRLGFWTEYQTGRATLARMTQTTGFPP